MIRAILFGTVILTISATITGAVYWHTREKWHDLGKLTGRTNGLSIALQRLCKLAAPGPTHSKPDEAIVVKANVATLRRHGDLVEIRCK